MIRPLLVLFVLAACAGGGDPPVESAPASAVPIEESPGETPEAAPGPVVGDAGEGAAVERVVARHVLVSYAGALHAPASITRSRQEARAQAEAVLARVEAGEDLAALARALSDCPSAPRGGFLGAFGPGVMHAAFEKAAFSLNIGQTSGVVETPFGFHVLRREALVEARFAQILVQWQGARRTAAQRSRAEAEDRIKAIQAELSAGSPFEEVARRWSDGPTAPWGGDLGVLQKGQMAPVFDSAAFALAPGEVSGLVESPLGFHIVKRLD